MVERAEGVNQRPAVGDQRSVKVFFVCFAGSVPSSENALFHHIKSTKKIMVFLKKLCTSSRLSLCKYCYSLLES
jgi:hypothetical protein